MQLDQYLRRDEGSNIVGFSLTTPLLLGVFLAVLQIANLVNVQTTLNVAANSGARVASTFDGTFNDGLLETKRRLENQGINQVESIKVTRNNLAGTTFIQVEIQKNYQIAWLNLDLPLRAVGRAIDEESLWQN